VPREGISVLFQIFVMFTAAKVFGIAGERIRIPSVISELVVGILIGPHLLGLVQVVGWTRALAELGAIVLLFTVGIDQQMSELLKLGGKALAVAVLGVILPFVFGWGLLILLGHSHAESIFMGAAMVATSVGITARVLQDLGVIRTAVATVILGAAVIDDILGMIVLAVVSSLSEGVNYLQIALVASMAIAFTVFTLAVGRRVVRRMGPRVHRLSRNGDAYFPLALIICLGLSVAAAEIEIAAIIGAFLAGLAFSEQERTAAIREKFHSLYEFLVPFFFVTMGMQMDVTVLGRKDVLLLAVLITLLAVIGKLVGCGLGAYRMGWRPALQVGVGMVPRGEVGIIVASIGLGLATISDEVYSVVIIMVLATTLMAPPALRVLFPQEALAPTDGSASKPRAPEELL
jgi:Kef-type K+ transport system membrane component KefB